MRFAAILDGTAGAAAQQAQALDGFLREGLSGDLAGETLVFYQETRDKTRLVELAPTRAVRLIKTTARRPERIAEILAAVAQSEPISLFLFAGGGAGTELAARLARRTSGAVLTDALSVEVEPQRLLCRKNVYSTHLVGRFELTARPSCVSIDTKWNDGPLPTPVEHDVLSDSDETGEMGTTPFEDLELIDQPSPGDLADSRFLVVAGHGAGSRAGVERIAAAARRMGAAFGVSRPVAMNAWAPMDRLIGVSGTRAAPELCIVVGASGAPAFFWGVEEARFIVAIDPDEHAAILRNADAALLDDGLAVIEELAKIITAEREGDQAHGRSALGSAPRPFGRGRPGRRATPR